MATDLTHPFDIFSAQARGNHELYERMRIDDPVHRALDPQTGRPVWFLTRYNHCVSFMKDKRFSKEDHSQVSSFGAWAAADTRDSISQHMLNLDEPDHARLKTLVHKAFTPTE